MAARVCLVHYHEVGLKGKNRAHFEHILMDNIKAALAAFSVNAVSRISGYILVTFNEHQADDAARVIRTVPGVARVSLAYHTNRDPQEYCAAAVKALREFGPFDSFKVHAKRSNTDYELTSIDINRQVGEVLCEAFPDKKVQMHDPEVMVHVLVVQGSVYVYARSERGVGGLPVGSAGKVVTLLSSGIDSPVATWMLARRGAVCVPVHFSGRPQTPDTSEYLVQDIIRALEPGVQIGRLYVVPFGDCQREISVACPSNLRVIMYRRIMYTVAERIAHIEGAKAIVTGESLGQVASQTLENIMAVNEAVKIPVSVKLPMRLTNVLAVADSLLARGARGVVMFNRFFEPDIDVERMTFVNGDPFSEPAELRNVLRSVALCTTAVPQLDVSVSTGVHDGEAAVKALLCGANAVQICSAIHEQGYGVIVDINRFIDLWAERHGFGSLAEFRGKMNYGNAESDVYQRVQYMKYFPHDAE